MTTLQTSTEISSKGAVVNNEAQAMEAIRRGYLAHPSTMKELRKFFLARRGARRGFTNPPTITSDQMRDLMNLGIIRFTRPKGSANSEIVAWPIVLECLDKVDADGNVIAKNVSTPPIPAPPSSRRNRESGEDNAPSSRRSGRPSSRFDREPRSQADFLALAHEDDDDDDVTQVMDERAMRANAAGMNDVEDQVTQS